MSATFLLALITIAACPVAMRLRLGRSWVNRPFAVLVLAGCLYHGLSETVIRITDIDQAVPFRPTREYADAGMLAAALGLLAMTIGYLAFHAPTAPATWDRQELARVLDWRLFALLALPLLAATMRGEGYVGAEVQGVVTSASFALQFLIPVLLLASFGYVLRHPNRFAAVLLVQTVLMSLAGQRLEVFVVALCLWLLVRQVGVALPRRQAIGVILVTLILAGTLSSVRATTERAFFYEDNSASARAQVLLNGLLNPGYYGVVSDNPVEDAAIRLDSNAFAGRLAEGLEAHEPVGIEVVGWSLAARIPSVFWDDKIGSLSLQQRSPEQWQVDELGLPRIDYLPGHVTYFYGALGLPLLLVLNLLIGVTLGVLEGWAIRRADAVGAVAILLLTQAALFFEKGVTYYLMSLRALVVIALALWLWHRLAPRIGAARSNDVTRSGAAAEPVGRAGR